MEISQLSKLFYQENCICYLPVDRTEAKGLESGWVVIPTAGHYLEGVEVHQVLEHE